MRQEEEIEITLRGAAALDYMSHDTEVKVLSGHVELGETRIAELEATLKFADDYIKSLEATSEVPTVEEVAGINWSDLNEEFKLDTDVDSGQLIFDFESMNNSIKPEHEEAFITQVTLPESEHMYGDSVFTKEVLKAKDQSNKEIENMLDVMFGEDQEEVKSFTKQVIKETKPTRSGTSWKQWELDIITYAITRPEGELNRKVQVITDKIGGRTLAAVQAKINELGYRTKNGIIYK